ncbi:hypothetical protein NUU61_008034 [Penicillium alfredii]|uniref:Uncharacterized protein n=1 Tax=Penicillium alfredii TaxID=1506179 RepID=A0A9W9ERN1_9EURO|nr:uncharacterized protein NUU61_008034 [Penicillium alfredii]KAJ5086727.1 hypothetical protein NUU61_008034 [Penicillium alfredii]
MRRLRSSHTAATLPHHCCGQTQRPPSGGLLRQPSRIEGSPEAKDAIRPSVSAGDPPKASDTGRSGSGRGVPLDPRPFRHLGERNRRLEAATTTQRGSLKEGYDTKYNQSIWLAAAEKR